MKYSIHNEDIDIQAMVDVMIVELKRIDPTYENAEPHILNIAVQNYIHQIKETGNTEFDRILQKSFNIPNDIEITEVIE